VRAAEIREGLRQWGFAQNATLRTKELIQALEADLARDSSQSTSLAEEHGALQRDHEVDTVGLKDKKDTVDLLGSKQTLLAEGLAAAREATRRLQEQVNEQLKLVEDTNHRHKQLKVEHEEVCQYIESHQAALGKHTTEAERRTTAAQRLAQRADEQAEKTLHDLKQTQCQLDSFKQANIAVKEAQRLLGEQLRTERLGCEDLALEHSVLHLELDALARHYIEALPMLPGVDEKLWLPRADSNRDLPPIFSEEPDTCGLPAATRPGVEDTLRPLGLEQGLGTVGASTGNSFTFGSQTMGAPYGASPTRPANVVEDAAMAMGKRIVLRV